MEGRGKLEGAGEVKDQFGVLHFQILICSFVLFRLSTKKKEEAHEILEDKSMKPLG